MPSLTKNKLQVIIAIFTMLFMLSCREKKQNDVAQTTKKEAIKKDYISFLIALDTLAPADQKIAVCREDSLLAMDVSKATNPFYYYFEGRRLNLEKKRDSSLLAYEKMEAKAKDDVYLLKQYAILDQSINNGVLVEGDLMIKMQELLQLAENSKSKLTHRYYDLLAKAYYQNQNAKLSAAFVEKYFKAHPYFWHPVIKQRYYDISFLLASRASNYLKMTAANNKAREFAISIKDSLAIARTYDNEAQIYARKGDLKNAVISSKIYFNYLKKTNNLNDIAFGNLATSFIRNNQPDSAIFYYKQAIAFSEKNTPGKPKFVFYQGMIDAYAAKGNYEEALTSAVNAYRIEVENIKKIEAVKVAEIQEKYEAEKKDRNISELVNRNELNERVIAQQRWTLGLATLVFFATLLFFYVFYRQRQLKQKNTLLQSENKRLNIEQKLLQVQLNPHFIFNSIANLQSLAATGNAKETVKYLTVFSGLLRNVLEQNRKDFISLEEEISSLDNYLQLQQMRFTGLFEYEIIADDDISLDSTIIPPMLIQPFVENAIEHGFRNINYKGKLKISFKIENEKMMILVDDNGIGLQEKIPNSAKKQSLARIILKERLDLLFNSNGQEAKFEITDKKDRNEHGVMVNIVMPELND
ncbi:MAG: sensor histidine kinase [Pedobacter sp.]|nr:MAG: sensor histidine kinase [Pedobacter sp.]